MVKSEIGINNWEISLDVKPFWLHVYSTYSL